jgi:hypothetical protein
MSLQLTAGVTGAGVGVDSAWEQKILKARKMLAVGAAESPASSARCVGRTVFIYLTSSCLHGCHTGDPRPSGSFVSIVIFEPSTLIT